MAERNERAIRNAHKLPTEPTELARRVGQDPRQLSALLTRRWTNLRAACAANPSLLPPAAWATVAAIPQVDAALSIVECGWPEHADMLSRPTWPEQVKWAADGLANIARLCRTGNLYGAIVLARGQLERWTANLAHSQRVEQQEGESTADWMFRTWSAHGQAVAADAQRSWEHLSEWLHGRDIMPQACSSEWAQLSTPSPPPEMHTVIAQIWQGADVAFRQARGAAWVLANAPETADIGDPDDPRLRSLDLSAFPGRFGLLQRGWSIAQYPEGDEFAVSMVPVDMIFPYTDLAHRILGAAEFYRIHVAAPTSRERIEGRVDPWLGECAVLERRARAIETARAAFDAERTALGDDFAPKDMAAKLFRFATIGHAARLVARMTDGYERDALVVAASALDSAWVLWLEDTDQAMTCVRGIVEQTARALCWRTKPGPASKLEASRTPPSRWIEKAGYGRLSRLVRALGEFAHTTHRSRWQEARDTLIAHNVGPFDLAATARGSVLNAAAYMLAAEVAARLALVDARLADAFRQTVTLVDDRDHAEMLEELLQRGLKARADARAAAANAHVLPTV